MAQTPMQELIGKIEKQMSAIPDDPNLTERALYDSYLNCKNWAEEALEEEKKHIENAYNDGYFGDAYKYKDSEEYYNQTYNQNK